jgi:hypothetical protein
MQLKVKIKDAYSEPLGAKCLERENICTDTAALVCTCGGAMDQGCHDDPAIILGTDARYPALTEEWQLYKIPLDVLTRGNWGKHEMGSEPPSSGLDLTQAYQLQFEIMRPTTEATLPPFDLWIDNVGFGTGAPPAPATGTPPMP